MAVSVVSFSFSMVAQPEHWLSLLHLVYSPQLYSPVSTGSLNSTDRNSTRRLYITFKLTRADMDTPPRLLAISGDRDVSLPLSLEWPVWSSSSGNNCQPVQRSLSSGASVYESIMGFLFYLVPFHQPISAHAISSHNCHQNVSPPSGALPWMAFLGGSTGQNITIVILANTPKQTETRLHSMERAAEGIGLNVNAHKNGIYAL